MDLETQITTTIDQFVLARQWANYKETSVRFEETTPKWPNTKSWIVYIAPVFGHTITLYIHEYSIVGQLYQHNKIVKTVIGEPPELMFILNKLLHQSFIRMVMA